jgi:hypothetical protein
MENLYISKTKKRICRYSPYIVVISLSDDKGSGKIVASS